MLNFTKSHRTAFISDPEGSLATDSEYMSHLQFFVGLVAAQGRFTYQLQSFTSSTRGIRANGSVVLPSGETDFAYWTLEEANDLFFDKDDEDEDDPGNYLPESLDNLNSLHEISSTKFKVETIETALISYTLFDEDDYYDRQLYRATYDGYFLGTIKAFIRAGMVFGGQGSYIEWVLTSRLSATVYRASTADAAVVKMLETGDW